LSESDGRTNERRIIEGIERGIVDIRLIAIEEVAFGVIHLLR